MPAPSNGSSAARCSALACSVVHNGDTQSLVGGYFGTREQVCHLAGREGNLQVLILGDGRSCASANNRKPHLQLQRPRNQIPTTAVPLMNVWLLMQWKRSYLRLAGLIPGR